VPVSTVEISRFTLKIPQAGVLSEKACYQQLWFSICGDLDRVRKHVIKAEAQFGCLRRIGRLIRVCQAQSKSP
jgi:hypothetical protein